MKLISVNAGRPRPVVWESGPARTGIFKSPVSGPVRVRTLNIDGDEQADLTVHGGIHKAVYAYPSEHYPFWQAQYNFPLEWGAFGENLTTEGLLESTACVGDQLQIGSAVLTVTQPRLPCFKLAGKFQDKDILRKFTESGLSGIYFAVETEGEIEAGASMRWAHRESGGFTIADAMRLINGQNVAAGKLERALGLKVLPDSWRKRIQTNLLAENL